MAPPTENEIAEGAATGIRAKRNKRKKELAKQRKAETQTKAANKDELLGKLSNVNLAKAREPNNMSIDSKILTIPAEFLGRSGSKHEVSGNVSSRLLKYSYNNNCHMNVLSNYFLGLDDVLYEIKPASGKGLGMFAIKKIKQGTEIIREEAIFKGSRSWFSKHAMFNLVSDEKKSRFVALHSQCNCGKEKCEETDFQKIWDANSFEIILVPPLPLPIDYAGPFVYLLASRINHDCAPNTTRGFTEKCQIVFKANKDIQVGEEITTDYVGQALRSVAARRQWLLKKYQFTCICQACTKNIQLSMGDVLKGVDLNVVNFPALPVLGEHTAIEEQAFAEVEIWHCRIQSKKQVILKFTILALSRQMQTSGENSGITVERV
jgi:hypothetical protein